MYKNLSMRVKYSFVKNWLFSNVIRKNGLIKFISIK